MLRGRVGLADSNGLLGGIGKEGDGMLASLYGVEKSLLLCQWFFENLGESILTEGRRETIAGLRVMNADVLDATENIRVSILSNP